MPCIILYEPQIPPNTGNIIRLAANCGFALHLIEPLGFSIDEKSVRRAGMDYSELASVSLHQSLASCLQTLGQYRLVIISTRGRIGYSAFDFSDQDALLFGNEAQGLPEQIWTAYSDSPSLRVPMHKGSRSLNLANAVAVVCYECWRQSGFASAV